MKKIIALLTTISVNLSIYGQANESPISLSPVVLQNKFDASTLGLLRQFLVFKPNPSKIKGKVKVVNEKEYEFWDGQVRDNIRNEFSTSLDEYGNIVSQKFGRNIFQYSYKEDENRQLTELTRDIDGRQTLVTFEYDSDHRIINRKMDKLSLNIAFKYGIGIKPKQAVITENGDVLYTANYIYSPTGFSIVNSSSDQNRFPNNTEVYVANRITEIRRVKNGKLYVDLKYIYDTAGNVSKVIEDNGKNITSFKYYDFDSNGNWTKCQYYKGNDPKFGFVIIRAIEYFN